MIEIEGMSVERILCKNTYTTNITKRIASTNVFITFLIEASRKSLELIKSTNSIPLGKDFEISATTLSTSSIISFAFEPEVCAIMQLEPGCPFTSPI